MIVSPDAYGPKVEDRVARRVTRHTVPRPARQHVGPARPHYSRTTSSGKLSAPTVRVRDHRRRARIVVEVVRAAEVRPQTRDVEIQRGPATGPPELNAEAVRVGRRTHTGLEGAHPAREKQRPRGGRRGVPCWAAPPPPRPTARPPGQHRAPPSAGPLGGPAGSAGPLAGSAGRLGEQRPRPCRRHEYHSSAPVHPPSDLQVRRVSNIPLAPHPRCPFWCGRCSGCPVAGPRCGGLRPRPGRASQL